MQNVMDILNIADNSLSAINNQLQQHDSIVNQMTSIDSLISTCQSNLKTKEELNTILINSAKAMRDKAKTDFEKIVTDALQFVTQDNTCKFVIEESVIRGKPAYEFYIETIVDGEVSRKKPEDSCGGGFVDIISVTGKVAYLKIFNNPRIMNACFKMDEPGKMISSAMSIKFAEYIKFLGKQFGLQIIMITHNENIASIADQTFYVNKKRNGFSEVSLMQDLTIDAFESILEEDFNEEATNDPHLS